MDKTCWDCSQRIGEECGVNGREVYEDTEACDMFEQDRDDAYSRVGIDDNGEYV